MREIKFRGRIKKLGLYAVGEYFRVRGTDGSVRHMIDATLDKPDAKSAVYEIDPDTLGQWTGCVDKAGVDIYEGDHVSFLGNHNKTYFGRIEFRNGSFAIVSATDGKHLPKAFILGDIDDEYSAPLSDVQVLGREST